MNFSQLCMTTSSVNGVEDLHDWQMNLPCKTNWCSSLKHLLAPITRRDIQFLNFRRNVSWSMCCYIGVVRRKSTRVVNWAAGPLCEPFEHGLYWICMSCLVSQWYLNKLLYLVCNILLLTLETTQWHHTVVWINKWWSLYVAWYWCQNKVIALGSSWVWSYLPTQPRHE